MVAKDLSLTSFTAGQKIASADVNTNFTNTRAKIYEVIDELGTGGTEVTDLQGAVGADDAASIVYSSTNYVTDATDTITAIGALDTALDASDDAIADLQGTVGASTEATINYSSNVYVVDAEDLVTSVGKLDAGAAIIANNYSKGMLLAVNAADASQVDLTPTTSNIAVLLRNDSTQLLKFSENGTKSLDVSTVNADADGFYSIYAISDGGAGPITGTLGIALSGVFDNATPFSGAAPADSVLIGAVYLYESNIINLWNAEDPNQSTLHTASWVNDAFAFAVTGTSVAYDTGKKLIVPCFFDSHVRLDTGYKIEVTETYTLVEPSIYARLDGSTLLMVREYFLPTVGSTTIDLSMYVEGLKNTYVTFTAGLHYVEFGGLKETGSASFILSEVEAIAEVSRKNVRAFVSRESDV